VELLHPLSNGRARPNKAISKMVSGKVVVEGEPLAEGATVTVLAPDETSFALAPEEEALLRLGAPGDPRRS